MAKNDSISHHGVLGQKWGIRRYQNEDGTLTDSGKKQYLKTQERASNLQKRQRTNKEGMYYDSFRIRRIPGS